MASELEDLKKLRDIKSKKEILKLLDADVCHQTFKRLDD